MRAPRGFLLDTPEGWAVYKVKITLDQAHVVVLIAVLNLSRMHGLVEVCLAVLMILVTVEYGCFCCSKRQGVTCSDTRQLLGPVFISHGKPFRL